MKIMFKQKTGNINNHKYKYINIINKKKLENEINRNN